MRRVWIAIIVGLVVLVAAVPALGAWWSERALAAEPCVDGSAGPPTDRFFVAQRVSEWSSYVPWTRTWATEISTRAAAACLDDFAAQCASVRDEAIEAARGAGAAAAETDSTAPRAVEWETHVDEDSRQTVCESWQPWMHWLESNALDGAAACPVCDLNETS